MSISKYVTLINEKTVFIGHEVVIEDDVVIYPNNYIDGKTIIKKGAVLLPNNYISNSIIGERTKIFASVIEDSVVDNEVTIGPFSHLRPNSKICKSAKIGNFVEIKSSKIGENSKVSHLSYVGDAKLGGNVNVGCGVVFVNYNGKVKQKSEVGNGSFIGCSVNVIAPVNIGERSFISAGTTVDKDVSPKSFVIGRSRMIEKPNRAELYLKGE